jgi:hypothetical protein
MATQNSTQYGNTQATPREMNHPHEDRGRVRVKAFDFTQNGAGTAGDEALLCMMDAGKIRILSATVVNSALGASRTMDLGHQGYNPLTGAAVAADPDAFSADTAVATAGNNTIVINTVFEDMYNWFICAKINDGTIPDQATLNGYILYVVD